MDKLNIAGILRTYAEQGANAKSDKDLKKIIRRLNEDLKNEKEAPNE